MSIENNESVDDALQDVIDELLDEQELSRSHITMRSIGTMLKRYDLNSPYNIQRIVTKLKELNVFIV